MAFKELMRWEGNPNFRWKKMYKGIRYVVTCNELNTPRTQIGSRQAANLWWETKLSIIKKSEETFIPQDEDDLVKLSQLNLINKRLEFAKSKMPELVDGLNNKKKEILNSEPGTYVFHDVENSPEDINKLFEALKLLGVGISENTPPQIIESLTGNPSVWEERLRNFTPTLEKNKVGVFADFFLREAREVESPATAKELRKYINKIIEEAGIWTKDSDITLTNSEIVNKFAKWLFSKNYEPQTHNKILGFFRRFIKRATQEDGLLLSIPRNLFLKNHRKKKHKKKIKTYTEIIKQINNLPSKMRLWTIFALNCGCGNCDLGNLRWEDIDQNEWRVTRKRVKTLTTDIDAPEVSFKLWNETITLLKCLPHRKGLLFQTKNNTPMYYSSFVTDDNNKTVEKTKDLFGSYWNKLKIKPSFSLGKIRSIGSTIIENEPNGRFVSKHSTLYLGRMPKGIDENHYISNMNNFMDQAIEYLGSQLFTTPLKIDDIPETIT